MIYDQMISNFIGDQIMHQITKGIYSKDDMRLIFILFKKIKYDPKKKII